MRSVWSRFPLLVRDLAAACGKEVRLDMHGAGTRLTRPLAENLADALAHLVRNAVDHGAETREERERAGKPVPARLSLRAWEEGDRVHIEVADDGPGVDLDRVRARSGGRARPDQELLQLIFGPGFTTAERVTDISGRGVGLDVVRTDIERAGGTVSVSSRRGAGTTFHLCVPVNGTRPGGPALEAGGRTTS
jgi:two-component system chemotaxis sensor kinase CheA